MKNQLSFLKTTLLGGVIFMIPLVLLVALLGKAMEITKWATAPFDKWFPAEKLIGVAIVDLIAITALLLACFLAGLAAQSKLGKKLFQTVEEKIFMIPGYAYYKGLLTGNVGSDAEQATLKPVLVSLDDQSMVAFEVERKEGGWVAIYLPGAPNPSSGSILLVTEDRVKELEINRAQAMQTYKQLGRGSTKVV